jgi:KDO2-lipid IV(A) lauroyltransferase
MPRIGKRVRSRAWPLALFDAAVGRIAAGGLRGLRRLDRRRTADFLGAFLRRVGPFLPEHRTGQANLRAAFPDRSPAEIEAILRGVWENLGRFAAEFAHLDRMTIDDPAAPGPHDIEYDDASLARFEALRASGKPALLFAAHLANWELPPLVAHRYGLDASVLYRRPNLGAIADAVVDIRAGCMGTLLPSGLDAPVLLANALEKGGIAGMLIDQYDRRGVDVTFFGRVARTSPLLARLARQIECPIYGTRIIRLPDGNRFRIELTPPVTPIRDADGRINIEGTMQAVTNVIERWVRDHPEQWLWVHRRWRPDNGKPRRRPVRPH